MFAKFDEISAMTLQDIKETECYDRTDKVKTKFAGVQVCGGV